MPARIAGIQARTDASGNIHVSPDSSAPCWNDATKTTLLKLTKSELTPIFKEAREVYSRAAPSWIHASWCVIRSDHCYDLRRVSCLEKSFVFLYKFFKTHWLFSCDSFHKIISAGKNSGRMIFSNLDEMLCQEW